MSADLLAEFGSPSNSSQPKQQGLQQTLQTHAPVDDFDSYGQFVSPSQPSVTEDEWPCKPQSPRSAQIAPESRPTKHLWHQDNQGVDVLFDASLDEASPTDEDDEWGEFESAVDTAGGKLVDVGDDISLKVPTTISAQNTSHHPNALPAVDLLSIDDVVSGDRAHPSRVSSRIANTVRKENPSTTRLSNKPKQPVASERFSEENFGEWAEFIDGAADEPKTITSQQTAAPTIKRAEGRLSNDMGAIKRTRTLASPPSKASPEPDIRPTNIPPPLVLLQLFPPVIEDLRGIKCGGQGSAEGVTPSELASQITRTLKVASRVIAGRTLRWKRDSILSQSTKIGPARAGKPGGMKLSSLSKSESVKEEQEAVGVIEAWRRHAPFFNSMVQSSGGRPVPITTEKVRIETASPAQGALKASHACALCGLKREERIGKVDENVEDSFGDWWTEHWGHTECKTFWLENSSKLHQR